MDMLVADLGGTQSRFFRFSCEDKEISIKEGLMLSSRQTSFKALLEEVFSKWSDQGKFLQGISLLVFAAAGPVRNGRIAMTNADFVVEEGPAREIFPHARCLIMNDFEAQAWACLSPVMRKAGLVVPGRFSTEQATGEGLDALSGLRGNPSPVVVTGAGTGLGAAWLLPCGAHPFVLPSEAGHMAFPFEGRDELDFSSFLSAQHDGGEVTAEFVLSGSGLALLHEYLGGRKGDPAIFTREEGFADSECCRLFARFYGRFCRTAALALLPQAVVLTGGVAGRTPALVHHPEFAREFLRARGNQKAFLEGVPVWLNAHPQAGLWGAAQAGAAYAASCPSVRAC